MNKPFTLDARACLYQGLERTHALDEQGRQTDGMACLDIGRHGTTRATPPLTDDSRERTDGGSLTPTRIFTTEGVDNMDNILEGWGTRLQNRWKGISGFPVDHPRASKRLVALIADLRAVADAFEAKLPRPQITSPEEVSTLGNTRWIEMKTTRPDLPARWVAQPFDSWFGFPRACWRLWKTRRHWL